MSTLLCARAASAHSPAAGRGESPRSAERNSLLNLSEKLPARQGRTRLRQFVFPGQPVLKKGCRPERTNPPAAVRVPRSASAEKKEKGEPPARFSFPAQPVLKKEKGIPFGTP